MPKYFPDQAAVATFYGIFPSSSVARQSQQAFVRRYCFTSSSGTFTHVSGVHF
jgi:hypothetical protein